MEELNKVVLNSLDGSDIELLPFIPYLLQDLREIGADPDVMVSLIKKNIAKKDLKILDLGCGKGAVSVKAAKELGCRVTGIDALKEFIDSARDYAVESNVAHLCEFETGDLRVKIHELKGYDVIILGAVGPVLGNLFETLKTIDGSLCEHGYVLFDDGYLEDESKINYDRCLRKSEFYRQLDASRFRIIQEEIAGENEQKETDDFIYKNIKKRADELIRKYPGKSRLFQDYLRSQEYENRMLEEEIVAGTWLLQK